MANEAQAVARDIAGISYFQVAKSAQACISPRPSVEHVTTVVGVVDAMRYSASSFVDAAVISRPVPEGRTQPCTVMPGRSRFNSGSMACLPKAPNSTCQVSPASLPLS